MTVRLQLLIALLLLIIGLASGYYLCPEKVVTQIIHDVKTVTVVQHDTTTVTVQAPDGTKTTTVVDKDVDTTHKDSQSDTTKTVTRDNPQWRISTQFSSSSNLPGYLYSGQIERRILGPIWIGAFGNANRAFGASLGVEF